MRQTRKRLGITIVEPNVHDALAFNPKLEILADGVLLDAPCSGLGTIRKHPEIKYARSPEDIKILAKKQAEMLKNAARYLKIGGTLVYCTCTVAAEENMEIIDTFAASHPQFSLEEARQILPSPTNDGFFVAKFSFKN
jgi:16S rRNA (cytosine967-C5)-methyltransferase